MRDLVTGSPTTLKMRGSMPVEQVNEETTMKSVMDGIVNTLDLQGSIHKVKKEEPKKEEEKEESTEVESALSEVADLLGDALTKRDKDEFLGEVEDRLKKGEKLDDIKKEIESSLKEEAEEEEPEEKEEEEEEDEDLIPKSKVDDIKAKMQKRIDSEIAKRKELESKLDTKPDDNEKKLDAMNADELGAVKKQVRRAMRHETDDNKLDELEDLLDKLDDKIKTYPRRFLGKQLENVEKILPMLEEVYPDAVDQLRSGKGILVETAKKIYSGSRSMQGSPEGQAEALQLAFEHLEGMRTANPEKKNESVNSLKRRLNTLKKKTTLSGKQSVASQDALNSKKLYKKAVDGDTDDKLEYVRKQLLPSLGSFTD